MAARKRPISRAIDTNVVARFLLNDDPAQAGIAARVIADGVVLPATVVLELTWVLRSRARLDRARIAAVLLGVLDLPSVTMEHVHRLRRTIGRYAGRGDLTDLIHLATCGDVEAFVTFDRAIAPAAGTDSPVRIETLD